MNATTEKTARLEESKRFFYRETKQSLSLLIALRVITPAYIPTPVIFTTVYSKTTT